MPKIDGYHINANVIDGDPCVSVAFPEVVIVRSHLHRPNVFRPPLSNATTRTGCDLASEHVGRDDFQVDHFSIRLSPHPPKPAEVIH